MAHRSPLDALDIVLASVDAVRNVRALYVLPMTFSIAGLLTAMAEASLAKIMVKNSGVEFALALVLPVGLVYLHGTCSVCLALRSSTN